MTNKEQLREQLHKELDILFDAAERQGHLKAIIDLSITHSWYSDEEAEVEQESLYVYGMEFAEMQDGSFAPQERTRKETTWTYVGSGEPQERVQWGSIEANSNLIEDCIVPEDVKESAQRNADFGNRTCTVTRNYDGSWRISHDDQFGRRILHIAFPKEIKPE